MGGERPQHGGDAHGSVGVWFAGEPRGEFEDGESSAAPRVSLRVDDDRVELRESMARRCLLGGDGAL